MWRQHGLEGEAGGCVEAVERPRGAAQVDLAPQLVRQPARGAAPIVRGAGGHKRQHHHHHLDSPDHAGHSCVTLSHLATGNLPYGYMTITLTKPSFYHSDRRHSLTAVMVVHGDGDGHSDFTKNRFYIWTMRIE